MADRLDAAGEETLLTLMRQDEAGEGRERRRLRLTARKEGGGALLEFAAAGTENMDCSEPPLPDEREISLRLRVTSNSSRALLHAAVGTRPWPIASTVSRPRAASSNSM